MKNNFETKNIILSPEDFKADGQVKWCPGCGGHAVLSAMMKSLPETGVKKENIVFVSGIGCSSRFPYYINTYGVHGLHGRAFPIASGIKLANPELSVWVITGDGDSMAIGGNHFIHTLRRNIDVNILLFNNKIYGLTKGQYSPTTPKGGVTKSSPDGTIENPFSPGELAIGAQGTFFARVVDNDVQMLKDVFIKAARHKGTSLIEILQNCVIFNNKVHEEITGKEVKEERQLYLEDGKPMIFGKNKDKGIISDGLKFKVAEIGKNGVTRENILIHDASDNTMAHMLSRMTLPEFPVAMGVIFDYQREAYEESLYNQIDTLKQSSKIKNVDDLIKSGNTFNL